MLVASLFVAQRAILRSRASAVCIENEATYYICTGANDTCLILLASLSFYYLGAATHLYNAMPGFHHRETGIVGRVLGGGANGGEEKKRPYFSIISDGIHCSPSAVKMAWNAHPTGTILVTDAMSAMGLKDGPHNLGTMKVVKTGTTCVIEGTDTLAGEWSKRAKKQSRASAARIKINATGTFCSKANDIA